MESEKAGQYRGALPTELVFRDNSRARESISVPIIGTPVVLMRQVSPTVIGLWRTVVYSEGQSSPGSLDLAIFD